MSASFGVYVHVPFCAVRCGYCDFNTYAPGELDGASPEGFVSAAIAEISLARVATGPRSVDTVFFGGGTPTLLPPESIGRLLDAIRQAWPIADDAEVTIEANPDTVTAAVAQSLAAHGVTRMSIGMQSSVPHVLARLDRTHDPANVERAVAAARQAGLGVSLDLIYGTPGESLADWERSVATAVALRPDHLSAYSLTIEPGTKMGAQLRRGDVDAVDPDAQASMYEIADDAFSAAGYGWYEISNWAKDADSRCRHNLGYWSGGHWWGIGPGAHSYMAAPKPRRWWNVKHPRVYAERLATGESPEEAGEDLDAAQTHLERVMLEVRLSGGLARDVLGEKDEQIASLVAEGLVERASAGAGRIVLTSRGEYYSFPFIIRFIR